MKKKKKELRAINTMFRGKFLIAARASWARVGSLPGKSFIVASRVTLGVSKREISRYETAIVVLRYACIPARPLVSSER